MAGVTRSFEELVGEAEAAPVGGWDFSWLEGRAHEDRPTWRYFDLVARRAGAVDTLLDLEVGNGGMVAALPALPRLTVGTEAYEPNVAIAARRLAARGAHLVRPDATRAQLPLRGATFELVTSRHPVTTWWPEIARVLAPGGSYLSQQVGPRSLRALSEYLMGPLPPGSHREPGDARAAAERAGLVVTALRSERPRTVFYDIGAIVYFLRVVVWIVPGFEVARYRERLYALHEQIERDGCFETTASRFLIEAVKPPS
jgi:SAM-dependent methyltransferase